MNRNRGELFEDNSSPMGANLYEIIAARARDEEQHQRDLALKFVGYGHAQSPSDAGFDGVTASGTNAQYIDEEKGEDYETDEDMIMKIVAMRSQSTSGECDANNSQNRPSKSGRGLRFWASKETPNVDSLLVDDVAGVTSTRKGPPPTRGARPGAYAEAPGNSSTLLEQDRKSLGRLLEESNRRMDKDSLEDNSDTRQLQDSTTKNYSLWLIATVMVASVFVSLAMAIPLAVFLLPDNGAITEEPNGALPPPIQSWIPDISNETLEALSMPDSPQSLAYRWMLKDPNLDSYPPYRKRQRFALMCIFHSLEFASTMMVPNRHLHECRWLIEYPCGDQSNGEEERVLKLGFNIWNDGRYMGFNSARIRGYLPGEIALLTSLEVVSFHGLKLPKLDFFLRFLVDRPVVDNTRPFLPWKELHLSNGEISGSIPSALAGLPSLTTLEVFVFHDALEHVGHRLEAPADQRGRCTGDGVRRLTLLLKLPLS